MSKFVVRVGDQDDYHIEDTLNDVVDRLGMHNIQGPLTPYVCTSPVVPLEMRGLVMGFESENYKDSNHISLYVSHGDDTEYARSLSDEEVEEINRGLESSGLRF